MIQSLASLTDGQKEELVASLACILVGHGDEMTVEKLQAVAEASGNSLSPAIATLFCSVASKVPGGMKSYLVGPGGGGGGGGGGGAAAGAGGGAAAAPEAKEEEKKEEEEEMDLAGGMDMFGGGDDGGGGGGGDY